MGPTSSTNTTWSSWAPSLDEALVLAVEICDEVAAGELRWVDPSA